MMEVTSGTARPVIGAWPLANDLALSGRGSDPPQIPIPDQ
jgi:hypothetical protein